MEISLTEIQSALFLRERGHTWSRISANTGIPAEVIRKHVVEYATTKPVKPLIVNPIKDKSQITEDEIMYPPHLKNWNAPASRTSFIEGLAAGAWIPSEHKQYSNPKLPLP